MENRTLISYAGGCANEVIRVEYIQEWVKNLKIDLLKHGTHITIPELNKLLDEKLGKKFFKAQKEFAKLGEKV